MKSWLLTSTLFAAFVLTGCEDPCKTGFELKNDLSTLETTITGTIVTPDAFDTTCQNFDKVDSPKLRKGKAFALHVANDIFSFTDGRCLTSHSEHRCDWVSG